MGRVRGAAERIVVAVAPEVVYDAVSDVTAMGMWSPVNVGATLQTVGPLRPGDEFVGHNRSGRWLWSTRCRVLEALRGEVFAFEVTSAGVEVSRWAYRFRPVDGGTEVTESWQDLRRGVRGLALYAVSRAVLTPGDPAEVTHRSMRRTLEQLKADLEGPSTERGSASARR